MNQRRRPTLSKYCLYVIAVPEPFSVLATVGYVTVSDSNSRSKASLNVYAYCVLFPSVFVVVAVGYSYLAIGSHVGLSFVPSPQSVALTKYSVPPSPFFTFSSVR